MPPDAAHHCAELGSRPSRARRHLRRIERRPMTLNPARRSHDELSRPSRAHEPSPWPSIALLAALSGTLLWLEQCRPLRRRHESKHSDDARNLALGAVSAVAIHWTERPLTARLGQLAERRRWGITRALQLPGALQIGIAPVLLDYSLYLWHVLTHRVPFLWRFDRASLASCSQSARPSEPPSQGPSPNWRCSRPAPLHPRRAAA
jgi:hypothetical protein